MGVIREAVSVTRGTVQGAKCKDCPFARDEGPNRPVVGEGPDPDKADWIVVGEGPGQTEIALNRPFIGASGQLVNKALTAIGVDRRRLWVTNATLCLPTPEASDTDKDKARKACAPRFVQELSQQPGKAILALGAVATRAVLGSRVGSVQDLAGSYHLADPDGTGKRAVIPTIHPAAILRGGAGLGGAHSPDIAFWNLMYDAAKVAAIAAGKDIVFREEDIVTECFDPNRAEKLIREMVVEARRQRMVAVDTETYVDDEQRHTALQPINAKMRAIGLATPNWGVSVAWNVLTPMAKRLIASLMADPNIRCIMHNAVYDKGVLKRHRMPVVGPVDDTLLKHHAAFPGLAHNLQRVGTQYFAIRPWKSEFRQGKDTIENLCRYCVAGGTPIVLADGSTKLIEDIVRQRLPLNVLTQKADGSIGRGRVSDWHRNRIVDQQWVQICTTANHTGDRGLIVTPDHNVYTNRGIIPAADVTIGDRVALPEIAFTETQRAAVLGTLLGDSTLAVSPAYRGSPWCSPGFALQGGHITVTGLTDYKVEFLKPHAHLTTERPATTRIIKGRIAHAKALQPFFTRRLNQLLDVAPLIYNKDWERRLHVATLRQLGPVGLAWWFMDDGFHQTFDRGLDGVGLSTNAFTRNDVEAAVEWFRENYGTTCAGKDNVIRITAQGAYNFCEEIAPHVIPTLRYKLVEKFRRVPRQKIISTSPRPYYARVVKSVPYKAKRKTTQQLLRAETRFCITVERDHNFFTSFGLVANCAKDTLVTARLDEPLEVAMQRTDSRRCYEVDLFCAEVAEWMYDVGIPISKEVNDQLYKQFWDNMQVAREKIESRANDPEIREKLWDRLAAEQAKRYRQGSAAKQDPEEFETRKIIRLDEIRLAAEKGAWKWKITAADHVAGWLRVHNIVLPTTDKARVSITKETLKPYLDNPVVKALADWRTGSKKHDPELQKIIEEDANRPEIQDALWQHIAFEQAKKIRKPSGRAADPDDYLERQKVRLTELIDAAEKDAWEWNIGSSDHVAAYLKARGVPLYFQTEKGATSTKKEILEAFVHIPEVRALLDYRENQKLFSTFIYSFFDRHDEAGNIVKYGYVDEHNRVHPRWSVHRITGRWSAEDPMCQNWPRDDVTKGRPNLRAQVVAPETRGFVGFDFGQIESRTIALLSGDPWLCAIFSSGKDIHSEFARIVWPNFDTLPQPERKVLRDAVKRAEFGAFYGGQIDTLWNNIKKDHPSTKREDIARMVMLMSSRMPGVTAWHQQLLRDVAQPPHEVRSAIYGRRRCFPLGNAEINDVYNYPVQATASDIMATGLKRIVPVLRQQYRNAFPIVQVHDSITFECDEADVPRLKDDVREAFQQTHTHNGVTVFFPVDVKDGRSWANA